MYNLHLLRQTNFITQDVIKVPVGEQLGPQQTKDLQELITQFCDIFSTGPTVIQHDIVTEPGKIACQRPYQIPQPRRAAVEEVRKNAGTAGQNYQFLQWLQEAKRDFQLRRLTRALGLRGSTSAAPSHSAYTAPRQRSK